MTTLNWCVTPAACGGIKSKNLRLNIRLHGINIDLRKELVMLGLQPIHIVIILVVALLLFGPKRLPEIGRTVGKALNEFRNGTREVTESLRTEINSSGGTGATNHVSTASTPGPTPAQSVPFQPATIARPPTGRFCIHCGAANLPEARFCNQCGQALPENTIKPADPSILGNQV
jgi:sec-independent protein translocase protein TatA